MVLRGRGRSTEVLVVHRHLRDDWSLPKGKLESGELSCVAAVRETEEESGVAVTLGLKLQSVHYTSLGAPKSVSYWIGRATDPTIAAGDVDLPAQWLPNDEVDEVRWVRAHRVEGILTYSQDVRVVGEALAKRRRTSPLVVLRHAKAEKRADFAARHGGVAPHDHERPLLAEGDAYTHMVAKAMAAYGVRHAYSSPAKRCLDTVVPLVVAPHQVIKVPAISEYGFKESADATQAWAENVILDQAPLVICSHRPVIPTLLRTIADASHSMLPPAKLKPAQFVVFHRPVKDSGRLSNQRAFTVEHSADALVE